MSIPRLAYIVQLDLPGAPIKIGSSKNVWSRLDAFSHGTPVDCRYIGLTLNGLAREKEMLAATAHRKIKGEWRYPTAELSRLVATYQMAGEWFGYAPAEYDEDDIRARILALVPEASKYVDGRKIGPRSQGYYWSNAVLARAADSDPKLGAHWAGFRETATRPSFQWPSSSLTIAAAA